MNKTFQFNAIINFLINLIQIESENNFFSKYIYCLSYKQFVAILVRIIHCGCINKFMTTQDYYKLKCCYLLNLLWTTLGSHCHNNIPFYIYFVFLITKSIVFLFLFPS